MPVSVEAAEESLRKLLGLQRGRLRRLQQKQPLRKQFPRTKSQKLIESPGPMRMRVILYSEKASVDIDSNSL